MFPIKDIKNNNNNPLPNGNTCPIFNNVSMNVSMAVNMKTLPALTIDQTRWKHFNMFPRFLHGVSMAMKKMNDYLPLR